LDARVEEAQAKLREAAAQAEQAQAWLAEEQARLTEAQAQCAVALAALQGGIAAGLGARGIDCSHEVRARLCSCTDAATLERWLLRAVSAGSVEEVFSG